jgi:protease I
MARVALLLGQGFEDSEFRVPYDRLREAGHTVEIIGAESGEELTGHKGKEKVRADRSIEDVPPDTYDALFIPGGQSPAHLRDDARFVEFVKRFDATKRPVAAICHGPQLLITAGLVRGRKMTGWRTVQEELRSNGAHVVDEEVVLDGNWITSRQPSDLEIFSHALLRTLESTPEREEEEEPARAQPGGRTQAPGMSARDRDFGD